MLRNLIHVQRLQRAMTLLSSAHERNDGQFVAALLGNADGIDADDGQGHIIDSAHPTRSWARRDLDHDKRTIPCHPPCAHDTSPRPQGRRAL
jgi:hypothetical protein